MSFKMRAERTSCARHITLDWIGKYCINNSLSKLKAYKVSDEVINWITEFLKSKFRAAINGNFSRWFEVLSGIPQGSLLGPLLFIIYTVMTYWQKYIFMQMMPNYITMFGTVEMLVFYREKLKILRVGPTSDF